MMLRRTTFLAGFALLPACNSTGVGNPAATMSLAIVADDEPELSADGGELERLPSAGLTHAIVVLGELRFIPCDASKPVTRLAGKFAVDLVTGQTRPKLPSIDVPEAGFCGLDAPLAPAERPAEIAGRSLFFSGVRTDGIPFILFADMQATLRVRAQPGIAWGTPDTPDVLWAMRPRRWASAMELDGLEPIAWGDRQIIPVNVNRHPLLYFAIRARLAGRSTLHSDLNQNRILDAEERSSDAILGIGLDQTD
jgi:hypothetical protein